VTPRVSGDAPPSGGQVLVLGFEFPNPHTLLKMYELDGVPPKTKTSAQLLPQFPELVEQLAGLGF
jgi:hypothetical protein